MIKKVLLLFFFLSLNNLKAQIDYSFSGYAVNFPIYSSIPARLANTFNAKENQISDLTRLRFRPAVYLWDGARLNLEYEIAALYFNSPNVLTGITNQKTNTQLVRMNWSPIDENNFRVNHLIDRLYLKQGFSFGNIIIGRQRISWGSGRIWNPTDLFNPNNPANFSKIEKDGADAISANYYIGNFTDLNIVFNPKEKIKESNFAARFRTNIEEYDLSLIAGRFQKRIIAGWDFAGNLFTAGFRGEGIFSFDEENLSDNFAKFIVGLDYQFTPKFYTLLEYHFNGEGKTNKMNYELQKLAAGEILNLNKNYFNLSANYQYTPLLLFSLSNMININDGSGLISLSANYSVTSDFYIYAGSQITFGEDFTEYWFYGNSFYMQFEYYF
ncbi:MAG: hypothetical protein HND52_08345 [Ignavibacteriae bacterium]|nr:hypothetical protein [Ignavibacteriota bacterium]NOG97959.1 hypothetical protein [Ignavibacteriota bacterium]